MCKRIIGLTLSCILVLASLGDLAADDPRSIPEDDQGVKEKLAEIQQQGVGADKAANFERVESLRLERYRILEEYLKKHPDSKSPWVKGVKALNIVDGDSDAIKAVAPGNESELGLVEQCKYKEAYETLVAAFRDTQKDGTEWPFGDLAVRAVEVVHQAAGILTLEVVQDDSAGNKDFIATNEELLALLEDAEADKLCLLAGVYRQWLSPPDPAESYLRAELRDNFRDRQKMALKLSHPLSLVPVRERSQPDHRDVPVAPYHGAVEILKSRALKWLVEDLNDTYVLAPDFFTDDYLLPGVIVDCQDASGSPLQLVYGRQLLCRMVDENGLTRTAFIFYDDVEKKWSQRYLSLLYLVPRDASVLTDDQRSVQSLLATLPEERSIKLGPDVIKQFAYPNDATADLLRTNTKILRVADIRELTDTTYRVAGNNPAHISDCLTGYLQESRNARDISRKNAEARIDPLKISPTVYAICKALELENDSTQHPLVRLLGVRPSGEGVNGFQKLGISLSVMTPDDLKAKDPNEYDRLLRNRRDGDRWMKRQQAVGEFLKAYGAFNLKDGVSLNPLLVVSDVDEAVAEPLWFHEVRDGEVTRYLLSPKFGKVVFRQDPTDFSKSWFEFRVRGATVHYPLSIGAVPGQVILGTESGRILLAALEEAGYGRPEALAEVAKIWQSFGEELPRKLEEYLAAKRRSSSDVSALEGAFKPPLDYMKEYGFRYIVDPRDNVIMNSGLTKEAVRSTGSQSLFTYIDKDGDKVPVSQHYSDYDYSDLHRNVYMEHLSKAVAYFPCPETCYWFHRERLRPLFNPSGRVPPYLVGWSKTNGEDDMFRVDVMSYGPEKAAATTSPEADLDCIRSELPMPTSYLSSNRVQAFLGKEPGGPELRGLNRLAGFIASLWAVPFAQGFPIRASDLTAFKDRAPAGFNRRDMLRHLLRYSARENAKWEDSHASIVLYNDLLSFSFAEIEQWSDGEEYLTGGSGFTAAALPSGRTGEFGENISRRRLRQLFGKGGNVFQLVPDTQAGADLADQIAKAVNREADKVELLLELAGVLSRTRYTATATRIWDEVVASKSLYLDPFIQESRLYFEAYGLQLGRQVERALERYTELVGVADARRGGVQHSEGVAPASGTGVVKERLDAIVEEYLSFEPAQVRRGLDREQIERYTLCGEELQRLKGGASFSEWLKAVNRLIERPEAIIARRYEFSPRLFLPLEYDSEKGFATAPLEELVREVSEIVLANPVLFERGGWTPEGEDGVRIASLMAWYFLEAGRFSDARRAYTLASVEYFRLANEASQRKRELEALVFQLNAYRQLCGRESVVYRSPGCCDSSVRIYAGVYGPILMWERRWFAESLEGTHARLARSEMLRLFDQIEKEIESRKLERDERRIFFADYRSVLGGAIPEPVLFLALNSTWFRDIKTAEERVAELEAAADAIDANDEEGKKAHAEKLKEAVELRDGLFGTMFDEIINVRATGLDEEVANLR